MSTKDLEAALSSLASITESRAVSVKWRLLKPDWLLSRRLFCVRKVKTWLNTTYSSVLVMNERRDTSLEFSKEWVLSSGVTQPA